MSNAQETNEDGESFVDELAPGTELLQGQFTIEKFLNSGGFGITYLAKDSLERRVVIKECFPSSFCHRSRAIVQPRSGAHTKELKSVVDLFVQEARSLAKMDHPNIVGVHQVFEDNQTAYMVLDFVEGRDLLDTLEDEDHGLTPVQIKGILTDVLGAVDYIHKQDILHRDISPDNILIDSDLRPVLIDFGAAREEATKKSRVLSALRVVKDGYSPQEFYIQGSEQTPSSDLYALGATFYHLIDGDIPPNSQARLASIAAGDSDIYQPLAGRIKGYDQKFLAAIDTALGILPKDRLQSAEEWLEAMEGRRKSRAMTTPIPMSTAAAATAAAENKSSKLVMLLGSAAAIAIIAVGGLVATGTFDGSDENADLSETAEPVIDNSALEAEAEAIAAAAEAEAEAEAARIAEAEAAEAIAALAAEAEAEAAAAAAEATRLAEEAQAAEEEAIRIAEEEAAQAEAAELEAARLAEAEAAEAEAARLAEAEAAELEAARLAEAEAAEKEAELAKIAAAEAQAEQERIAAAQAAEAEAQRIAELAEKKAEEERLAAIAAQEAEAARLAEIAAAEAKAEEERLAAIAAAEEAEAARIAALGRIRPETRDNGASAAFFSSDISPFVLSVIPTPASANAQIDLSAFSATSLDDASLNRFVTVLPEAITNELVASIDTSVPAPASTVSAAVDITSSNGILSAWSVELPFSGDIGSNVISETAVVAPVWAKEGVEIVAVNGRAVTSMADITSVLRATAEPADGPLQPVSFSIKSPDSDETVEQTWQLPILQETVLLNGLGFTTRFIGEGWKTVVSSVPDGQSELEIGDELVAFMGTSEQLTERTSLTDIITRELDNGVDQFSFAVSRSGSMWVASMTYAGGA